MPRFWKALIVISLVLNAVCLLYVYALSHPNPYGPHYYETEQMKLDIRQLKSEISDIKSAQAARAR